MTKEQATRQREYKWRKSEKGVRAMAEKRIVLKKEETFLINLLIRKISEGFNILPKKAREILFDSMGYNVVVSEIMGMAENLLIYGQDGEKEDNT